MYAFHSDIVQAAEEELLAQQQAPDEMMKLAARAVATTAETMASTEATALPQGHSPRVMIVVGPGGNGGDGLFAGAHLLLAGFTVRAIVIASDEAGTPTVHEEAFRAFCDAGGDWILAEDMTESDIHDVDSKTLIIDAIAGLSSGRGLDRAVAPLFARARVCGSPILAIDVPTGINCDTGITAEPGLFVESTATVTFGSARLAHAIAPACGDIIVADLTLPGAPQSFSETLVAHSTGSDSQKTELYKAHPLPPRYDYGALDSGPAMPSLEPHSGDDKYSSGVLGLCAGSSNYPGAGLLSAAGAVAATPSMVRAVGAPELTRDIIRAHPEVVTHPDLASAGRIQALTLGPGRGTDDHAHDELTYALSTDLPLVLDADALTLVAHSQSLRQQLQQRLTTHAPVILTPHDGEFARLAEAYEVPQSASSSRLDSTRQLAMEMGAWVVRKGRMTTIANPSGEVIVIDCGSSWAATPGSGDVLSGIIGAFLARWSAANEKRDTTDRHDGPEDDSAALAAWLRHAIVVHSLASGRSAQTVYGPAPTTASRIAAAIPEAIAALHARGNHP